MNLADMHPEHGIFDLMTPDWPVVTPRLLGEALAEMGIESDDVAQAVLDQILELLSGRHAWTWASVPPQEWPFYDWTDSDEPIKIDELTVALVSDRANPLQNIPEIPVTQLWSLAWFARRPGQSRRQAADLILRKD